MIRNGKVWAALLTLWSMKSISFSISWMTARLSRDLLVISVMKHWDHFGGKLSSSGSIRLVITMSFSVGDTQFRFITDFRLILVNSIPILIMPLIKIFPKFQFRIQLHSLNLPSIPIPIFHWPMKFPQLQFWFWFWFWFQFQFQFWFRFQFQFWNWNCTTLSIKHRDHFGGKVRSPQDLSDRTSHCNTVSALQHSTPSQPEQPMSATFHSLSPGAPGPGPGADSLKDCPGGTVLIHLLISKPPLTLRLHGESFRASWGLGEKKLNWIF